MARLDRGSAVTSDLNAALPWLTPRAIAWAVSCEREIATSGDPPNDRGVALARAVEIAHPERMRIKYVQQLPLPQDPDLRRAGLESGLLGARSVGLTVGYGVFIVNGYGSNRLYAHEFRHVRQYEQAGSISAFLWMYLKQVASYGYENAPLEVDARNWERMAAVLREDEDQGS